MMFVRFLKKTLDKQINLCYNILVIKRKDLTNMWKRNKRIPPKVNWYDVKNFAKKIKENKQHMIVYFASEFCLALGVTPRQCDTIKANLITQEQFDKERN